MMNLLIEYYQIYLNEGLEYTDDIKQSIFQEKKLNDPIGEFIDEYLEYKENNNINVKQVIDLYISINKLYKTNNKEKCTIKEHLILKLGEIYKIKGIYFWKNWTFKNTTTNIDEDL